MASRINRRLQLAYLAFGLPVVMVLMEMQRTHRGGGILRFFALFVLIVIVIIIGVLALIAFLIYRFLRRRR